MFYSVEAEKARKQMEEQHVVQIQETQMKLKDTEAKVKGKNTFD